MLALTISKSLTAATYFTIYPSCFTESQQSLGVGLAGHHFSETTHDHWLKPCIAACAPGSLMMQRWTEGGTSEVEDFRRRKVLKHKHIQVLVKKPGDLYIKGHMEVWNNTFKRSKENLTNLRSLRLTLQSSVSLFLSPSGWFWPIQRATDRSWPGRNLAIHKLVDGHSWCQYPWVC